MGGCRCSYKNCKNTTKTTDNIHFFHYPVKHKERCMKWIENACKPKFYELEEDQLRNKVICEVHFEDKWFPNSQKKRLLQGAVPTLDAGCENENQPSVGEKPMFLSSHHLNDIQVLPANEDGTIFLLDTENMFSRSQKVESYIYKNGVLVPSSSTTNSNIKPNIKTLNKQLNNKPSTSHGLSNVYYNPNEMEFEPVANSSVVSGERHSNNFEVEEEREFKEVLIKKELPESQEMPNKVDRNTSIDYMNFEVATNRAGFQNDATSKKSAPGSRQMIAKNPIAKSPIEKPVNRNYLRKIKQHSRDIATIKRMLMQKTHSSNKPDTKSVLNLLQEQLPSSLYTIISLLLGDKHELNDEDIEFFTTFHRTSPEAYQLLSEKYKWNLPSVDVVDSPE